MQASWGKWPTLDWVPSQCSTGAWKELQSTLSHAPTPLSPAHMHFIPSPSPFLCVVRGPQRGQSQEPPGRPPHGGAVAERSSAHQLTTSPPLALLSLSKSKKSQKTFVWDPWCPFHTTWKNETAFSHVYRENRT